jgi:hypothetical protein
MVTKKKSKGSSKPYVIIRAKEAGCFAGYLEEYSRETATVVLSQARRLWYWSGAASLSQLAMEGSSNPTGCKFPPVVSKQEILGVIEVIDTTEAAQISIEGTPVWRA